MRPKWIIGFIGVVGVLVACSALMEEIGSANAPTMQAVYAQHIIEPGATWKVYIKGQDPDGDIKYIYVFLEVPSRPLTPYRIPLASEFKGHISGYLTLNTMEFGDPSDLMGASMRLLVALEDRGGLMSDWSEFPLAFAYGVEEEGPEEGVFREVHLGNIPVEPLPTDPATPGLDVYP